MRRALSYTVAALLVTAPAAGQPVVGGPGFERVQIGGDLNRYEARYGEPQDYSLCGAWPEDQSIRTVGYLSPAYARSSSRSSDGVPRSTPRTYLIESENGQCSLALAPVQEIANRVAIDPDESMTEDGDIRAER